MNGAYPLFACMGHLGKGELEKRLDRNWWKYLFSSTYNETSLYLKTDGDVVEDPDITSAEVDVFVKAGALVPEDSVLDLCCGQGRHSLELARRGFKQITGIDYSQLLVSTAQQRAQEQGFEQFAHFFQGDASHLPFEDHHFDVVLCLGNSFGYFQSVNDDLGVLMQVARVLKPGGRLVLDLADGDYLRSNFQPRSWEWVDNSMFVVRERELALDGRLISREIITLTDKGVIKDQIYSERLFNVDTISHLFKQVGITDPQLFKELGTDSKRDQDLGMMEQRLVITGTLTDVEARNRMSSEDTNLTIIPGVIIYPSIVVDVDKQGHKGKGLKVTRNMNAGEVVEQFVGKIVSFSEIPDDEIPFVVWVGADLWMMTRGNARYVNHSCDPNCGLNPDRAIVTRRAVKEGEELCISYNVSTEDGDWDPRWTFRCECDNYNCQNLIDRYVDLNGRPFTPRHKTPPAPK